MVEAVEQGGGQLCVAKDSDPFPETELGDHDKAGALIELVSRWNSKAPHEVLVRELPSSSRMTTSSLVRPSAIGQAFPFAFSCSGALTSSVIEMKRTIVR